MSCSLGPEWACECFDQWSMLGRKLRGFWGEVIKGYKASTWFLRNTLETPSLFEQSQQAMRSLSQRKRWYVGALVDSRSWAKLSNHSSLGPNENKQVSLGVNLSVPVTRDPSCLTHPQLSQPSQRRPWLSWRRHEPSLLCSVWVADQQNLWAQWSYYFISPSFGKDFNVQIANSTELGVRSVMLL